MRCDHTAFHFPPLPFSSPSPHISHTHLPLKSPTHTTSLPHLAPTSTFLRPCTSTSLAHLPPSLPPYAGTSLTHLPHTPSFPAQAPAPATRCCAPGAWPTRQASFPHLVWGPAPHFPSQATSRAPAQAPWAASPQVHPTTSGRPWGHHGIPGHQGLLPVTARQLPCPPGAGPAVTVRAWRRRALMSLPPAPPLPGRGLCRVAGQGA